MTFYFVKKNYLQLLTIVTFYTTIWIPESLGNALIQGASDTDVQQLTLAKSGKGLNAQFNRDEPVQKSATCKFGRPISGSCSCSGQQDEPICGSDSENYANACEFLCAQKCNPRLVRLDGECSSDGGPPKRIRLNFTKKEKIEDRPEHTESRSLMSDYDDQLSFVKAAGQLSRGLSSDPGFPMDGYLPFMGK